MHIEQPSLDDVRMPTIDNVTLDTTANVYFGGLCVSHTFHLADGTRKSAGVIFPSSLTFGPRQPRSWTSRPAPAASPSTVR